MADGVWFNFILAAIPAGMPLLLGTLGEILTEKAGNLNLGVEGMMYMGAIFGFLGGFYTNSAVVALLLSLIHISREVYLRVHYKPGLSKDDRFDLRNNYSICLWRLGKLDEAIATIKRAAADNKTTLVYTTLGLFLILKADETGDFSEAVAFNNEAYDCLLYTSRCV